MLLCAVTGSHHYGFSSPDSDLDLKGIHLRPTPDLLGLTQPAEAHDRLEIFEGVECDYTSNEARQALSLLLKGNGNMLERILSPLQLVPTPELLELQQLTRASLSRRLFGHYFGFFRSVCHQHLKAEAPRAKSLLYAYRVALTGLHLLRTGELEANLSALAPEYGFAEAHDLIAKKQATAEKVVVDEQEDRVHQANWPRLEALMVDARDHSPLPDKPPNSEEIHGWLVALRLREIAG